MSEHEHAGLLPSGSTVPFKEIDRVLLRQASPGGGPGPAHALAATVVVFGQREALVEAAHALEGVTRTGAVRAILISGGDDPAAAARIQGEVIAIEGLLPRFFNNAVGALRLSSLPMLVWWRAPHGEALHRVADLADRLVLDQEDPAETWADAARIIGRTAVTDLRWTRLTRWRALMAHFFDMPDVRGAASSLNRLEVWGGDRHTLRLFAGWLSSALGWNGRTSIALRVDPGAGAIAGVRLGDGPTALELALAPSGRCVQTTARVEGRPAVRTVALGGQGLAALIGEELRVRSRDLAFEQALSELEEVS